MYDKYEVFTEQLHRNDFSLLHCNNQEEATNATALLTLSLTLQLTLSQIYLTLILQSVRQSDTT